MNAIANRTQRESCHGCFEVGEAAGCDRSRCLRKHKFSDQRRPEKKEEKEEECPILVHYVALSSSHVGMEKEKITSRPWNNGPQNVF